MIEPSYELGSEVTKNHIYKKGYIKITSKLLKKLELSIVFRKILPIKIFHNGSEIIILKKDGNKKEDLKKFNFYAQAVNHFSLKMKKS